MGARERHVVLGSGPVGFEIGRQLEATGDDVSVYSVMGNPAYDMIGTSPAAIDGADADSITAACEGATAIYVCLNAHYVDWYELMPPRLEAAIDAAATSGARLIYHDNVYMYGDLSGPLTEESPYSAETRKGRLRAEMATKFTAAIDSGRISGAIGRSADMYGPGALNSSFDSTLGQRHFYPLLAGKAVDVLGDVDQPHTYAFVDDVARDLIRLAHEEEALGDVWHLPAAPTLSHRDLLTIAFEGAGLPVRIRGSRISGYVVRVVGRFQKDLGEVAELLDQFERPLVVSHQKFEAAFGAAPTSHEVALGRTLDWYRQNPLS